MKKILVAFVIFLSFLFIARPAYHGGLFVSHDDVQVSRTQAMTSELLGGQFPVRYVDEFGNGGGYFLFNFYSPLVYYLGAIFNLIGISAVASVKLVYLFVILVGTLGIFTLLRSKTSVYTSTLGTVIFLFSPYVFHDLFHRGALPEATAMMLTPWALWAFLRIKEQEDKKSFILAAIIFALLILAHLLTAAMLGAILLVFAHPIKNKGVLKKYFGALLLAVALASFYFLPSLLESNFTRYSQVDFVINGYKDQFVNFFDHLGSSYFIDEKKPFLGVVLFTSLAILLYFVSSKQKIRESETIKTILFTSLVAIFIMSPSSYFLWEKIEYLRFLQFPYRILTFLTVVLTFGISLLLDQLKNFWKIIFTVITLASVLFYLPYYQVTGYQYVAKYQAEGPCRTTAWNDEHLPVWVQACMPPAMSKKLISSNNENLEINSIRAAKNNRQITFVPSGAAGKVQIHKYYFPGWKAQTSSGEELPINASDKHGLITLQINSEQLDQEITVSLKNTNIRTIGEFLSLATIFLLVYIYFSWKK